MSYTLDRAVIPTLGHATRDEDVLDSFLLHRIGGVHISGGDEYESRMHHIASSKRVAQKRGWDMPILLSLMGTAGYRALGKPCTEITTHIASEDIANIDIGAEHDIQIIILPPDISAVELLRIQGELQRRHYTPKIFLTVHDMRAIETLPTMLELCDGCILNNFLLAKSVPLERIPRIEHSLIQQARLAHKNIYLSGNILSSMEENDMPHAGELAHIFHSMKNGASGVLLGKETSHGTYPVESVKALHNLLIEVEQCM